MSIKDFWSLNESTFYCLYDRKRTLSFKKAIKNIVSKGDVVIELGAGSGVLSLFAADAGASKVYAVELDDTNARSLRNTIKANGYDDIIEVVQGDALKYKPKFKADVIICEMIATGMIEELQVPAMNHILQYTNPDTKVLLNKYKINLDLVNQKDEYYNKKFDVVRFEFPDKTSLRSKVLSKSTLVKEVDLSKINKNTFINKNLVIEITKPGTVNGLRVTGDTVFCDGSTFDYSLSYSFPIILPVPSQVVKKGDTFKVKISYSLCEGPHQLKYFVQKNT